MLHGVKIHTYIERVTDASIYMEGGIRRKVKT